MTDLLICDVRDACLSSSWSFTGCVWCVVGVGWESACEVEESALVGAETGLEERVCSQKANCLHGLNRTRAHWHCTAPSVLPTATTAERQAHLLIATPNINTEKQARRKKKKKRKKKSDERKEVKYNALLSQKGKQTKKSLLQSNTLLLFVCLDMAHHAVLVGVVAVLVGVVGVATVGRSEGSTTNIGVDFSQSSLRPLPSFWPSCGWCPPDPHEKFRDYFLTEDERQNHILVGACACACACVCVWFWKEFSLARF